MTKFFKQYFFLLIFASIFYSQVDDEANCYNYIIDDDSFYLYADGYVGGIQMTITHDESFTIDLTDDAMMAGYSTIGNETTIIIVVPEFSLLFTTTGPYEIVDIIVAANMNEGVAYCPDDNLGELNQEDIVDESEFEDLSLTNISPQSNNIISLYPNPFNPITTIKYIIETPSNIELHIYNISGEQVENIIQGYKPIGAYQVNWEPKLSSGQYFIQLISDNKVLNTRKAILLK